MVSQLHWRVYRYRLPLTEPLRMLGHSLHERVGLLLQLEDETGKQAEGEIAPLLGVHSETLEDCLKQLHDGFAEFKWPQLASAVRFGLEMAQWSLREQQGQTTPAGPLEKLAPLPVNGLLVGSLGALAEECERLRSTGFQAVKLKVGRESVAIDVERIRTVREMLGPEVELRLDANRAWTLEQAQDFAGQIQATEIAYCEEPLRCPEDMPKLHESTGLPLALDESLWTNPEPSTLSLQGVQAVILKPGVLGGWRATSRWVRWARKQRLRVVFSSCFESGLGLAWIARMATALSRTPTPCGLDTGKWLAQDLVDPSPKVAGGFLYFPETSRLCEESLELVGEGSG